jgi:hypothetical protein
MQEPVNTAIDLLYLGLNLGFELMSPSGMVEIPRLQAK